MNITVIGSGYVGLVTGACLADLGNHVICLDIDQLKVTLLQQGVIPIYEPGLEALVKSNVAAGRLNFTSDVNAGVAHGLVQIIAVGTPSGEDGSADLQHVLTAARAIGKTMSEYKVIVNKSTVPVGTADKVRAVVQGELDKRNNTSQSADLSPQSLNHTPDFSVVSNPEFLKEGSAIDDFNRPDRIVIGGEDERAIELMRKLYEPYQRNHDRLIVMNTKSAELTKYAANAMLATRISFMNELANLAEKVGADIGYVRYAGCGYGGSCIPKDIRALQRTGEEYGAPLKILGAVQSVNEVKKYSTGFNVD